MLTTSALTVISDIHLAVERDRGLFRADKELAAFLNSIADTKEEGTLVIAGDFLDYLVLDQDEDSDHFYDYGEIVSRTRRILEAHNEVFDGLSRIASSDRHHLVIMAGNHDPELIFSEVQNIISDRLGPSKASSIGWVVQGEGVTVKVGDANVFIEHGNRFDRYNRVDHRGLRDLLCLKNRGFDLEMRDFYTPPFGSKLILDYVNPIRDQFPWLDYIEPGTDAGLIVMRELTTLRQKASFLRAIKEFLWLSRDDEYAKHGRIYKATAAITRASESDAVFDWINQSLSDQQAETARGWVFKKTDDELIAELESMTKRTIAAEQESLHESITPLLDKDIDLVITGHTHKPMANPIGRGLYMNTGTWGQVLKLPNGEADHEVWKHYINNLRLRDRWHDHSELIPTLARVSLDSAKGQPRAVLAKWNSKTNEAVPHGQWRFGDNHWSEEGLHE